MIKIEEGIISTFRGIPEFNFPFAKQRGSIFDLDLTQAEKYALEKYGQDIIIYSQYDIEFNRIKIIFLKEKELLFRCYAITNLLTADQLIYIIDYWQESATPKKELLIKSSGDLLAIPHCPCCGGTINLKTLVCDYCNQQFYIKEGTK